MGVDPHHRQPAAARREAADRADVGAAAAAEHERARRQVADLRRDLLVERRLLDHRGLGIGEREPGRGGHRLAAAPPGPRDAHEAGRVLAAAAVALVLVVDRDGGERAAVGAAGAERAHCGPLPRVAPADDVHPDPLVERDAHPSCSPLRRRGRLARLPRSAKSRNESSRSACPRPRRRQAPDGQVPDPADRLVLSVRGPCRAEPGDIIAVPDNATTGRCPHRRREALQPGPCETGL